MPSAKVSVIVPTRNRGHLLGRAIRSVLAQTFTDFELLVVDDASQDDTQSVIRSFADPRIRGIRRETSQGPSHVRNTGIREAGASRYFAFLDDDDEWLPHKLERQIALFESSNEQLAAVGCGRIDYSQRGSETFLPRHRGLIFEDLLARRARGYGAPLIVVRRFPGEPDLLFDESLPCLEDADYSLRIARRRPVDFVPEVLVKVHRDYGGQHAWNAGAAMEGYLLLAAKYSSELAERPRVLSYYHFCIARELGALGRSRELRERLKLAMASDRMGLRLYAWYLASFLGPLALRICARPFAVPPPESAARRFPLLGRGVETRGRAS